MKFVNVLYLCLFHCCLTQNLGPVSNVKDEPLQSLEKRISDRIERILQKQLKSLQVNINNNMEHACSTNEVAKLFDGMRADLKSQDTKLQLMNSKLLVVEESVKALNARLSLVDESYKVRNLYITESIRKIDSHMLTLNTDFKHLKLDVKDINDGISSLQSSVQSCNQNISRVDAGLKALKLSDRSLKSERNESQLSKKAFQYLNGIHLKLGHLSNTAATIESQLSKIKENTPNKSDMNIFRENLHGPPKLLPKEANDRNAIRQMKVDVLLVDSPKCIRFNKARVYENAANAISSLRDLNVKDIHDCAKVCGNQQACFGFVYRKEKQNCRLLRSSRMHPESISTELVDVWLMHGGGFGYCSSIYNINFRSSKYRLVTDWVSWDHAKKVCEQHGGKLAELTSRNEIEYLSKHISTSDHVFVGGVEVGGPEPAGGWRWYQSNIPIPSNGFQWASGQPSNNIFFDEDALIWDPRNKRFHDARYVDRYQFLCECYPLIW